MIYFNSRDPGYKSPFGAVRSGSSVSFSLSVRRSVTVSGVSIRLRFECTGETSEHVMSWSGLSLGMDRYSCEISLPEYCGICWYSFAMTASDGCVLFYGDNEDGLGGEGAMYGKDPKEYQLSVYEASANAPKWFGEGITYHIFPDRFCRKGLTQGMEGRTLHDNWDDCPEFRRDENGEVKNCDFFGGNIRGILSKLDYLRSLNVTTIYLSPIFRAYSNHRYDTGDYHEIDPMFGTNAEFEELCEKARKLCMRVILDGVFNHTGYDSRYFNALGRYDSVGAYQSKDSPYFPWFEFEKWPDKYSSWWGIYTLPQVSEMDESYRRFIFGEEDSVVRRWLRAGASGWRLDVADELPDEFISELNSAAQDVLDDAVIIGEVWEDASNKISYDVRRRYILRCGLHGVMNYPLRNSVIEFLLGGPSGHFIAVMESIRENYPEAVFMSSMNIIGTHDTPRILTILGCDKEDFALDKQAKALMRLPEGRREAAKRLLMLGSFIQFCFPGSPCVYYGDEAGMEGFEDPLNRKGFPWGGEDGDLLSWYRKISRLRAESPALSGGSIEYIPACEDILAFRRECPGQSVTVAVNRCNEARCVWLPFDSSFVTERVTGRIFQILEGGLHLSLPPLSCALFS